MPSMSLFGTNFVKMGIIVLALLPNLEYEMSPL